MTTPTTTTDRPVAIVTGAAGALGRAISARLAADGVCVVLADIDLDAVKRVGAELPVAEGLQHLPVQVDMGDSESVEALVDAVGSAYGRIDYVVNNAAVNHRGALRDFEPDHFDHMMAVNLRGPAVLAQKVTPYWDRQRSGALVNIASRAWVAGGPVAYASCKAGIVGLTRSLARELASAGVTSNAVAPGLVPSAFTLDGRSDALFHQLAERSVSSTPLGRLTTPEDVAGTVAFLCSPDASYITGEVIHVCGGSQLAPIGGANNH